MACTDGGVPYPPSREEILAGKTPQMLCAIVGALQGPYVSVTLARVLRHADWKEAGVTQEEFEEWLELHRARDDARRITEMRDKQRAETVRKARKKLSFDELKALGLDKGETE